MKYLDEFRDPKVGRKLVADIRDLLERAESRITLMEVCGTHTMNIARAGIKNLFKDKIRLLSGPGCPVCVSPNEYLDRSIAFAERSDVILTTFGDMMKVPGSRSSLWREKGKGRNVKIVYSPMDALRIAIENPEKKLVFLGVGFETTAPTIAATIQIAAQKNIHNFYVYGGNKIVPPAMKALVCDPQLQIDGFICPGHVSTIIGAEPYEFIARDYGIPCVIAGFEPTDILRCIRMLTGQIVEEQKPKVEIQYARAVKKEGNPKALEIMSKVFEPVDSPWRGLGNIPQSGLRIKEEFSKLDAEKNIEVKVPESIEHQGCICGDILRGIKTPADCGLFGRVCDPENPIGPCMVSTEGTCAAWYKYEG